ncbi:MAG: type II toxin-antitoxin system YhaV family toxin [Steroidobacteraceae bacterium]
MTPQVPAAPLVIDGWSIFAHPLFLKQLEALIRQVEALQQKDPHGFVQKNATKRLAAIAKLVFENIPRDPTAAEFGQGDTLGPKYKHWFRAKFFMQYRLFLRFHVESKIVALGWVNDEDTKRAYGTKDDAYRVFSMLAAGHPPDDWNALIKECHACAHARQSEGGPSETSVALPPLW